MFICKAVFPHSWWKGTAGAPQQIQPTSSIWCQDFNGTHITLVFCAALFLFMWQYLVLMPCFSCINFSISVSRAQHYSCFRKQEKTLSEVIQLWPQSRVDLNFLNPNPEVGCISDRKIYPWADSVTWDVNRRLAPNCDEESGHLPFGFLWCWIAYLQALLQSQESWSGNWKEKYSNW